MVYTRVYVRSSLLKEREGEGEGGRNERFVCEDGATMCLGTYARRRGRKEGKGKVEKRGDSIGKEGGRARGHFIAR